MNVTPQAVPTKVFASMPDRFLKKRRNHWTDANRGGEAVGCFLEGPSFDRQGNLWVTDIPFGRIFRISPDGSDWTQVTEYDGWPNGLKIHKDGRIFIADYKRGIVLLDPASGKVTPLLETHRSESFKGVNDLFFAGPDRPHLPLPARRPAGEADRHHPEPERHRAERA
jgi:gluconolactonase